MGKNESYDCPEIRSLKFIEFIRFSVSKIEVFMGALKYATRKRATYINHFDIVKILVIKN